MKRLIGLMVCLSLLLSPINDLGVNAQTQISQGHYVTMGTYDNSPLTWQIIHMEDDGTAVLWQNNIITYMAFDGAESGVSGNVTNGDLRQAYGSNDFVTSNIYEWLNSEDAYVTYTTAPPTEASVHSATDIDEALLTGNLASAKGFLTGFTPNERNAIETTVFTTKISAVDSDDASSFTFDIGSVEAAYSGWHVGRSNLASGQVFLLSIEEIKEWVLDGRKLAQRTNQSGEADYYWLRTPVGESSIEVATIDYGGNIFKTTANFGYTGVVPAIRVKLSDYSVASGNGRPNTPFLMDFSDAFDVDQSLDASTRADIESLVLGYKNQLLLDDGIAVKEAIAREIEDKIQSGERQDLMKKAYDYYLAEADIILHRELFQEGHLLANQSMSDTMTFSDMKAASKEDLSVVDLLVAYGIVDGYEDGTFRPDQPVTRAETAKLMTILAQISPLSEGATFKDVESNDWYYDYVRMAKSEGYIKGYDGDVFKPNQTVTFDEVSTMIARLLRNDFGYYDVLNEEDISYVAPEYVTAGWALKNTALLVNSEILDGQDSYEGSTPVNRIEIAQILGPVLELIYQ